MFCTKCGASISDTDTVCPNCNGKGKVIKDKNIETIESGKKVETEIKEWIEDVHPDCADRDWDILESED